MLYRQITEADLPEIFEVRTSTREHSYTLKELEGLGITVESVAQKIKGDYKGFLCLVEGRIAGFSMGNRSTGEMWVIAILPEFEGMGLGGRLITLIEDWLWREGCDELWLTTGSDPSMRAYGFYLHMGWHEAELDDEIRTFRKRKL